MKQILLTVAMLAVAIAAGAQNKDQLLSSIEKAKVATENPKKASNPNTWIKYGDAFMNAYNSLFGDLWIGSSQTEAALLGGGTPMSEEQKEFNGLPYLVQHFQFRDLYYNANGVLEAVIITTPITEDNLLVLARDAYLNAIDVDAKGSKAKVITEKLSDVRNKLVNDAMSYYTIGDMAQAAYNFESALPCSENAVINGVDTTVIYYAGVAYGAAGNNEKAKQYYERCIDLGYYQNGDVACYLSDIYKNEGNAGKAKECLNEAFAKFPGSQFILVSLINLYMDTNDDPQKILDLIHTAQENEPNNASLAYAEGNVYNSLGDLDNAVKCYEKSVEIDPDYVYGYYAIASAYIQASDKIVEEANALDIRDVEGYDKLMVEFENYLELAIAPYEQAFGMTDDVEIKVACASALKQIFFRFRNKGDKYKQGYEKYNNYLVENGIVE